MAEKFKLEVTTPGMLVYGGSVEMATIPGEEGEFGVLSGHSPLISTLKPGVVNVYANDNTTITSRIFVGGGFAEVNGTEAAVLATEAYDLSKITKAQIQKKIDEAEVKLKTAENEFDKRRALEVMELNKEILSYLAA